MLAILLASASILVGLLGLATTIWLSPWFVLVLFVAAVPAWTWWRAKREPTEHHAPRHSRILELPPPEQSTARHAAPAPPRPGRRRRPVAHSARPARSARAGEPAGPSRTETGPPHIGRAISTPSGARSTRVP